MYYNSTKYVNIFFLGALLWNQFNVNAHLAALLCQVSNEFILPYATVLNHTELTHRLYFLHDFLQTTIKKTLTATTKWHQSIKKKSRLKT